MWISDMVMQHEPSLQKVIPWQKDGNTDILRWFDEYLAPSAVNCGFDKNTANFRREDRARKLYNILNLLCGETVAKNFNDLQATADTSLSKAFLFWDVSGWIIKNWKGEVNLWSKQQNISKHTITNIRFIGFKDGQ